MNRSLMIAHKVEDYILLYVHTLLKLTMTNLLIKIFMSNTMKKLPGYYVGIETV
jgi:hypothetical protein